MQKSFDIWTRTYLPLYLAQSFFHLAMTSSTRWLYFAKGFLERCAMRAECCSVIMVPTSPTRHTRPGPSPSYFEENLHLSEKTCLRKSFAWENQLKHSSHHQLVKRARRHWIYSAYALIMKNWCIIMSYWFSTNFIKKFLCQNLKWKETVMWYWSDILYALQTKFPIKLKVRQNDTP